MPVYFLYLVFKSIYTVSKTSTTVHWL